MFNVLYVSSTADWNRLFGASAISSKVIAVKSRCNGLDVRSCFTDVV